MDFDLTDEQQLIQRTAREFTDNEIILQSRENARNHHFDLELVKKVAAQGYLGAIVPAEYGGAGLDYFSYGLVVEEIGRGDSAIRTVISVQTSLVCSGIVKFGSEEQKPKVPGREEYSYPSVMQSRDGKIYVSFTYRRQTIKVVSFEEDWLRMGGD